MNDLPVVRDRTGIQIHEGERVQLIGCYTQIDARRLRNPPPVYRGHVAVVLSDGTQVLLYPIWFEKAVRPSEEIAEFEGHVVAAVGKLFASAPSSPDYAENLMLPCLLAVESITEAQEL
jgi:hypothetical protein